MKVLILVATVHFYIVNVIAKPYDRALNEKFMDQDLLIDENLEEKGKILESKEVIAENDGQIYNDNSTFNEDENMKKKRKKKKRRKNNGKNTKNSRASRRVSNCSSTTVEYRCNWFFINGQLSLVCGNVNVVRC